VETLGSRTFHHGVDHLGSGLRVAPPPTGHSATSPELRRRVGTEARLTPLSAAWLRWLNWIISGLLALCAVGAAAITLLGKLGPQLGWSIAGALAVGSAAASQLEKLLKPLQSNLRRRQQERSKRERELSSLLTGGRLHRVEDADPYGLGVRRSRSAEASPGAQSQQRPPYVSRVRDDVDQKLRRHLRERTPFVLLIGESRAGKSRTAFEAAVSEEAGLAGHLLIAPIRFGIKKDTLSRIFGLLSSRELGQPPALLWLDDLHRYLDAGALSPSLLNAWRQQSPPVIVLATIRSAEYNRLRFESSELAGMKVEILEQARSVLEQADPVDLLSELCSQEVAEAGHLYPGHDWTEIGLGQELVLAPALLDKLRTAAPDKAALVDAVVDWERAGLTMRIPA
jgi:cellulose synthase operon protein C